MSGVILSTIAMKRESKSFTDSLYAVLTAAGLFEGPKYLLSGLSGMAFKFTVHEKLLPLSVSAYGQWGNEHLPAVTNLGIYTEWDAGRTRHPTFRYYQQDAVNAVRGSLDRGIGVIYWIPEFGVIYGYDDADRVFYVRDGFSEEEHVVLYDNLGLNFTSFWYYRIFGEKVPVPPTDMLLESLRMAIDDWDTPYKTLPDTNIGSGRLAYTFLMNGLEKGDFDEDGAVYILDSYAYARNEIARYLSDFRDRWPELNDAALLYEQLVQAVTDLPIQVSRPDGNRRVIRERIPELIHVLAQALSLEDQAIDRFRAISRRYPDCRRTTVPRWGAHSPR